MRLSFSSGFVGCVVSLYTTLFLLYSSYCMFFLALVNILSPFLSFSFSYAGFSKLSSRCSHLGHQVFEEMPEPCSSLLPPHLTRCCSCPYPSQLLLLAINLFLASFLFPSPDSGGGSTAGSFLSASSELGSTAAVLS